MVFINKRQKLVQSAFLNNEEAVIRRLKQVYGVAQKDIEKKTQALQDEINRLGTLAKLSVDDEEKAQLLSMQQSKIYQKQYQDAMKKQIGSVLDNMQVEEFKTVSEYLQKCYEEGFIGTMFDLQGQGIPLCFPMDQEAMVRAVQLDSKISNGLYSRLGEDVSMLKKKITAQVSRGIATGMTFDQVAQQLAGYTNIGFNNAVRIARTEGHRIQVQSTMDACYKAKEKGADVVKQWDATLDGATRESHQAVDGEIRELDKPFSNGLMFPGDPSGGAAEVVNCRCALLQRAKWALDDDFTKMDNETGELVEIKAEDYEEFKKQYWSEVKKQEQQNFDITEGGKYEILPYTYKEYSQYMKHMMPEYHAQRMTHADNSVLWDSDHGYIQNGIGCADINKYRRGMVNFINPKYEKTISILDKRTSNATLKHDYVGFRKVDVNFLKNVLGIDVEGLTMQKKVKTRLDGVRRIDVPKNSNAAQSIADKINALVGTEKARVLDNGYTSISMAEDINYFTHFPVQFQLQMPTGTKGLLTSNWKESEFITKPGTAIDIIGAEIYNDGEKDCVRIFGKLIQE